MKMFCRTIVFVQTVKLCSMRNSSLFVHGEKAKETYRFLIPHMDFPMKLNNLEKLQENISARKYLYDVDKLSHLWHFYEDLNNERKMLEKRKKEVSEKITALIRNNNGELEINKHKIHLNIIKENLKLMKKAVWEAEEKAYVYALKYPVELNHQTPVNDDKVIYEFLTRQDDPISKDNLRTIRGNYLKKDEAMFELGSMYYFSKELKHADFIQFSNSDFCKSLIIEGCGSDNKNPNESFILHHSEYSNQESKMHLVGGASLPSFFTYLSKNVLTPKVLPLKCFTIGRSYNPFKLKVYENFQSTAISCFIACRNDEELSHNIESLKELYINLYKPFGKHFRLSLLKADVLGISESMRIDVEMFSTILNRYINVAFISVSDDYISKRLMLTYQEGKEFKFPKVVSGTFLDVRKLLQCFDRESLNSLFCMKTEIW